MKDLSMHIMDIVQNSTRAGATLVTIEVAEELAIDRLTLMIADNGCGMDEETLKRVADPFFTSRTTRKVGLGIPLLMQNAEQTGGQVLIESEVGKGTTLQAVFSHSHIDRPPMGDVAGTIALLISGNPNVEFVYTHRFNEHRFEFDSREIKAELDGVSIHQPRVVKFMKEMIHENLLEIGVEL
jgi:anti-sigma regulatory factor (Ser/Thr protein kinase)